MTTTPAPVTDPAPGPVAPSAPQSADLRTPRPRSIAGPLTVLQVVAHLAFLAGYGTAVFAALGMLLGIGIPATFIIVGVVLLLAFVYLLYGAAFLETARVEGLYRFGLPILKPRRSHHTGFPGFLHTVWLQFIDGGTWRAIAHLAIGTILGAITWGLFGVAISATVSALSPLWGGTGDVLGFSLDMPIPSLFAAVIAVVALAAMYGVALLHGVLSRVLVAPIREAQLAAEARAAAQQAQQATARAHDAAAQRADAIRAGEVERTRIERDLHDGVQPRLVSVGMTLGLAQTKIDNDPEQAKELVSEAHTSTKAAITELRQLARGIHASVLDDRGLDAALSALAGRSHIPVQLDVRIEGAPARDPQAALYFAIAESLTNAAKHSRATECRVVVRSRPDEGALWARIEDNGVGGARVTPGGGIDGVQRRITAVGGSSRLDSPAGGPTSLEVSVPCAF